MLSSQKAFIHDVQNSIICDNSDYAIIKMESLSTSRHKVFISRLNSAIEFKTETKTTNSQI